MPGRFPIIYVRGFAGATRGINEAVSDPFYGFNEGSTHVRVGGAGDPIFYQFESPLVRLLTEEGYGLFVEGSQDAFLHRARPGEVPEASVWVHRFYDTAASTWERRRGGDATPDAEWEEANQDRPDLSRRRRFSIEAAAADLLRFVETVLEKTGAGRVHLVAHSMGGLICRSLLQRVIPDRYGPGSGSSGGPGGRTRAADFVDRLFTYGTPHGGIEFDVDFGILEAVRDEFGIGGADIFGPERMYEYLTPASQRRTRRPRDWDPRVNPDPDNFPTERIFCLVGTNARDYGAAMGLATRAVGVKSDGLVTIENALVTGANHAYVHRSHSGRYGMVNSEEGYQNLIRFLFADVRATADIVGLHLPDVDELTWQAETEVAVRGMPVLLHQQVAAHHCPVLIEKPRAGEPADRPVPLVTTYLWSKRARSHGRMRYTLHVRLLSLEERSSIFFWRDHLETTPDFDDVLVIDVEQGDTGIAAWATWASEIPDRLRQYEAPGRPLTDLDDRHGEWFARVPFPAAGRFLGADAAVTLRLRSATG